MSFAEDESTERPEKRVKTEDVNDEYHDVGGSESKGAPAPKRGRRRAGRLALIMSMPVDVFDIVSFQFMLFSQHGLRHSRLTHQKIASHLGPIDLLRMSRASKTLRSFLLSKSSKSVWAAAEAALGLPACPSDLSNPNYASLLFESFCTVSNFTRYVVICSSLKLIIRHVTVPVRKTLTL